MWWRVKNLLEGCLLQRGRRAMCKGYVRVGSMSIILSLHTFKLLFARWTSACIFLKSTFVVVPKYKTIQFEKNYSISSIRFSDNYPKKSAVLFRMPVVAGLQIVSRRRVFELVILQDAGCRMQVAAVLRIVAQGRVVNELIIPTHIREISIIFWLSYFPWEGL